MPVKTINLRDFSKELGKFSKNHLDRVRAAVSTGIMRSIPDLVKASPVDTGQYAASWDYIEGKEMVMVGNFAPHAPVIEYGARPHTPPIKPLLQWAKRVLRDPSQPPEYSPEVWRLAKGTQQKIARYGQAPRHIMEKNVPMILKNIEMELKRA